MRLEVFLKEAVTSIEAIPRPRLSRSPTAGTCGRRACREDRAWPPRLPAGTGRGDAAGRSGPLPPPAPPEKKIVTRTKERYTAVQDLRAGGESISAIPRSLTPPCHARPPALRHGTPPGTSGGAPESGPTRTSVLPPLTALVADGDPTVARHAVFTCRSAIEHRGSWLVTRTVDVRSRRHAGRARTGATRAGRW